MAIAYQQCNLSGFKEASQAKGGRFFEGKWMVPNLLRSLSLFVI
jgi:hypothetical protein